MIRVYEVKEQLARPGLECQTVWVQKMRSVYCGYSPGKEPCSLVADKLSCF